MDQRWQTLLWTLSALLLIICGVFELEHGANMVIAASSREMSTITFWVAKVLPYAEVSLGTFILVSIRSIHWMFVVTALVLTSVQTLVAVKLMSESAGFLGIQPTPAQRGIIWAMIVSIAVAACHRGWLGIRGGL